MQAPVFWENTQEPLRRRCWLREEINPIINPKLSKTNEEIQEMVWLHGGDSCHDCK